MTRLVLIDGHAILHRAYHALPPLTSPSGTPVNAVYGFTSMLLSILKDLKPDFLAVAFDLPQKTFRQEMAPSYQAQRPEMEDGLSCQIALLHELLDNLGILHYSAGGFEADDVIGTLAGQAGMRLGDRSKNQGTEVIIVTGDRDMFQLIDENTKVCVPVRGLAETKIYDEKTVREEFGVNPSQWVDVKALKGDASDNYGGVRGIGPKTALKLITRYGSLEKLYEKLEELGKEEPKLTEKLAVGKEEAKLSQKLATIVRDAPVKLDLAAADVAKINWPKGLGYMRGKLGFRSLAERIEKGNNHDRSACAKAAADEEEQMKLL